jgi:hypothetical protein
MYNSNDLFGVMFLGVGVTIGIRREVVTTAPFVSVSLRVVTDDVRIVVLVLVVVVATAVVVVVLLPTAKRTVLPVVEDTNTARVMMDWNRRFSKGM